MDTYSLPDLPYDYGALAPHLSAETLQLHHDKHHAAYVKGANATVEALAGDVPDASIPGLHRSLAFHVSGHVLHSLFWESMSPNMGQRPEGELKAAIVERFGSVDTFMKRFNTVLTTIQGSGWAILVWDPLSKSVAIAQIHDHQSQLLAGTTILLAADGWEHAYYVDYRNDKAAWAGGFGAVANWEFAAKRFAEATA